MRYAHKLAKIAIAILASWVMASGLAFGQDVKALLDGLKSPEPIVRIKSAKELGALKAAAKDAIPSLRVLAAADEDEDVRIIAARALEAIVAAVGEAKLGTIEATLAPLLMDLKGKDLRKRLAAIEAIGELGSNARGAGASLVEFGLLNAPRTVQDAAAAALKKIDPDVYGPTVDLVFDQGEDKRFAAVRSLGMLGRKGKSSLPALRAYYMHQKNNPRGGAYLATQTLRSMAAISPDDKELVDAVVELVSSKVVQPAYSNTIRRTDVIEVLRVVKVEDKVKVASLVQALSDPSARALAASELGELGAVAKSALPVLNRLKLDKDAQVREAATKAVESISVEIP